MYFCSNKNEFLISIHAPPRGATVPVFSMPTSTVNFNSRPSARGDVLETETDFYRQKFQFTPLREGRRLMPCWRHQRRFISIHAPPRGATCGRPPSPQSGRPISIHAPPRGATLYQRETTPLQVGFQFTPLREGRRPFRGREVLFRRISIHAPPRGATTAALHAAIAALFQFTPLREGRLFRRLSNVKKHYFNSRPSARGDMSSGAHAPRPRLFQFTPLREGRRCGGLGGPDKQHFNSRPSARGDARLVGCAQAPPISIHAPPRGATSRFFHAAFAALFQFTPLREGRHGIKTRFKAASKFQFTPLREGRPAALSPSVAAVKFQFTPLREGRRARMR